jgi:hypothetical protein
MRRLVSLVVMFLVAVPFGASIAGCGHHTVLQYCNGQGFGPLYGQVASVSLSPTVAVYGESVNYGQVGSPLTASAADCKGTAVSVTKFTYASTDTSMKFADINPANGQICAGSWNRNTGGGIADYTVCTPATGTPPTNPYYITATGGGATSNGVAVYVHPTVTSVVIGAPSTGAACTTDPSTNCCPSYTSGPATAPPLPSSCVSHGSTVQFTSKAYNGTTNITCQVGHLGYAAQNSDIFTVDQYGIATAQQPGGTLVTAAIANSNTGGSAAGYFSTCPPASITLSLPGTTAGTTSANVAVNNNQPVTATVLDTNGVQLTGLSLQYNSTNPITTPVVDGLVTPVYPATSIITVACTPGACNPAPFDQIDLYGNGEPLTSNGITINTGGRVTNEVLAASTQSQYLYLIDFSTNQSGTLLQLPFVPNSLVATEDGTVAYLGSPQALMQISVPAGTVAGAYTAVPGTVLAVSPNNGTIVVTDPTRNQVELVTSSGGVSSFYGGTGTHASFSPDSNTVYVTTTNNGLLVHSAFTGWVSLPLNGANTNYTDIAVTVPHLGAFFAGNVTESRSYCSTAATTNNTTTPPTVNNTFYPIASDTAATTDLIAASTDGKHIFGATAASLKFSDVLYTTPTAVPAGQTIASPKMCPLPGTVIAPGYFTTSVAATPAFTGIVPTAITGVYPATNTSAVFVTYTGAAATGSTTGQLPLYVPGAINVNGVPGPGTLTNIPLAIGATAPVAGVFSTDNLTFYTGTTGDNLVHQITFLAGQSTTGWKDTSQFAPALPLFGGALNTTATPNLLSERPRRATS